MTHPADYDRWQYVAQLHHLIAALEIEMPGTAAAALGLPAQACKGEALYDFIADNPLVLTRLASKLAALLIPKLLDVADLLRYEMEQQSRPVMPEHVVIAGPIPPSAGNPRLN